MSHYREEHVAELQWLEDGINILAVYTFLSLKVLVRAAIQLCRYGFHVYRNRRS